MLSTVNDLRPIWLTDVGCTPSDANLPACVLESNVIGYANCASSSLHIAAVDCGEY